MTGHSHLLRRSRSSEPRGSAPLWAEGAARDPDQPFPRPRLEGAAGPQAQHALGPAGAAAAPARYGSPSGPSGGRRAHLPAEPGPARPGPARPRRGLFPRDPRGARPASGPHPAGAEGLREGRRRAPRPRPRLAGGPAPPRPVGSPAPAVFPHWPATASGSGRGRPKRGRHPTRRRGGAGWGEADTSAAGAGSVALLPLGVVVRPR